MFEAVRVNDPEPTVEGQPPRVVADAGCAVRVDTQHPLRDVAVDHLGLAHSAEAPFVLVDVPIEGLRLVDVAEAVAMDEGLVRGVE